MQPRPAALLLLVLLFCNAHTMYVKPGQCPDPSHTRQMAMAGAMPCNMDVACYGSEKCCRSSHGRRYCIQAVGFAGMAGMSGVGAFGVAGMSGAGGMFGMGGTPNYGGRYQKSGRCPAPPMSSMYPMQPMQPTNSMHAIYPSYQGYRPYGSQVGYQSYYHTSRPYNIEECRSDFDCAGARKCCVTLIGMSCMLPETYGQSMVMKRGRCPNRNSIMSPARYPNYNERQEYCMTDAECMGMQKCCSTVAGNVCLMPESEYKFKRNTEDADVEELTRPIAKHSPVDKRNGHANTAAAQQNVGP